MADRPSRQGIRAVEIREGELVVDSQRTADLVRSHRDLWRALSDVAHVVDIADDLRAVADAARQALDAEPDYDALPTFVRADESWADTLPPCIECGKDVPWAEALLMPCSDVEDGDVTMVGIVHRGGCGDAE